MERLIAIGKETEDNHWDIEAIFKRLEPKPMSK
jgi:hypothetical protein